MRAIRDSVLDALDRAGGPRGLDLGLRVLLVLFVLSPTVLTEEWFFRFPLRGLAIAALVLPPLHRDPRLWGALAALMLAKTLRNWWTQDNHLFLLTWFSCGAALALFSRDPERETARNARLLLGIAFAFATLWKALASGEFLDGSYFEYTFLTDPRFAHVARVAGASADALQRDLQHVHALASTGGPSAVPLESGSAVGGFARAAAIWTCVIELAIAVTCLAPSASLLSRARHAALWAFAATTYFAVPVEQFGWTLMGLGAVAAAGERGAVRAGYVLAALLVLAYDNLPIATALVALY